MKAILSPSEMRSADAYTIETLGVPSATLMELAGKGVAEALAEALGGVEGKDVVVVAGKGNNGGDGLVAARWLHFRGARVKVFLLAKKENLKGDPKTYLAPLEKLGVPVIEVLEPSAQVAEELKGAGAVIDAIFGTGFSGAPKGLYAWAIESINEAEGLVVAVDIPSGVDGETGQAPGAAVIADITVTMARPKLGHFLYPGKLLAGELKVVDIGIPPDLDAAARRFLLEAEDVSLWLPLRWGPENKRHFGRLAIAAGSWQYSGAALLAAAGALRSGVGLLYLVIPESLKPHLIGKIPEAILVGAPEKEGAFTPGLAEVLRSLEPDALVLGPGFTRVEAAKGAVLETLREIDIPTVLDADGIWAASGELMDILEARSAPLVLTPHPGEMRFLTGGEPSEIDRHRVRVAEEFVEGKEGVVLVLKGAPTVIAEDGITYLNSTGNPGMAVGGSGDVLAGVIGSLLVQGVPPLQAAAAGAFLHGLAGDKAAEAKTQPGLTPWDLVEFLPAALKDVLPSGG